MTVLGRMLFVGLERVIYPDYLDRLREHLLTRMHQLGLECIAVSCDSVSSIDVRSVQALNRIFSAAKLLGASCYVVNLRPEVAGTIVGLGQNLIGAHRVHDLEQAQLHYARRGAA